MTTIYVRHPISDYLHWRRVFDAHDATRREHGLRVRSVQRNVDRPLEMIITLETAGPVEVSSSPSFKPLLSGKAQALQTGVADWNRHPTPFLWNRPPKPKRLLKRRYVYRI